MRCAPRCYLSLEIAAITAVVSVIVLVFPTAVLVRLKLPKLTILMEAITILPIVVPPIVLAAGTAADEGDGAALDRQRCSSTTR